MFVLRSGARECASLSRGGGAVCGCGVDSRSPGVPASKRGVPLALSTWLGPDFCPLPMPSRLESRATGGRRRLWVLPPFPPSAPQLPAHGGLRLLPGLLLFPGVLAGTAGTVRASPG